MRHLVVASILLIAACTEPDRESDPVHPVTPFAPPLPCEAQDCNLNGSNMGAFQFHELHERGLPNNAGLVLDGLWKLGVRYQPDVARGRLVGYRPGSLPLLGLQLQGSYLRLVDANGAEWRIYIEHVSNDLDPWQFPDDGKVQTYRLRYLAPGAAPSSKRGFCNQPPAATDVDGGNWAALDEAFFFTGDRYDRNTKRVTVPTTAAASGWFNMACVGSLIAKVHMLGYTSAAARPAHDTSLAERNDLFAMYTGNVCGDGYSHTLPRTPIRWVGSNGWHDYNDYNLAGEPSAFEAVWGDGRAKCLDTFRIAANQPSIVCGTGVPPPSCDDLFADGVWTDDGTLMSAVP